MSQNLALCVIRVAFVPGNAQLSDELVDREITSDINRLNGLTAEEVVDSQSNNGGIQVHRIGSSQKQQKSRKSMHFSNVSVTEYDDKVELSFADGYDATIDDAEVVKEYPKLDLSRYGRDVSGEYQHPNSGTVHIVTENGEIACGRNDPDPADVEPVDTVSNKYSSYCSQCSNAYNGLPTQAADISVQIS